jgi:hypothetical protein
MCLEMGEWWYQQPDEELERKPQKSDNSTTADLDASLSWFWSQFSINDTT